MNYNDNELIDLAPSNERAIEILCEKYKPLVIFYAQKYCNEFPTSLLDINDFVNEGMLTLINAIYNYRPNGDTLFSTYVGACINKNLRLISLKTQNLKHNALNSACYLEDIGGDCHFYYQELENEPEKIIFINSANEKLFKEANERLTKLEKDVFKLKAIGFEMNEISILLNKDYKSIDNALQRIRRKLKQKHLTNVNI